MGGPATNLSHGPASWARLAAMQDFAKTICQREGARREPAPLRRLEEEGLRQSLATCLLSLRKQGVQQSTEPSQRHRGLPQSRVNALLMQTAPLMCHKHGLTVLLPHTKSFGDRRPKEFMGRNAVGPASHVSPLRFPLCCKSRPCDSSCGAGLALATPVVLHDDWRRRVRVRDHPDHATHKAAFKHDSGGAVSCLATMQPRGCRVLKH